MQCMHTNIIKALHSFELQHGENSATVGSHANSKNVVLACRIFRKVQIPAAE